MAAQPGFKDSTLQSAIFTRRIDLTKAVDLLVADDVDQKNLMRFNLISTDLTRQTLAQNIFLLKNNALHVLSVLVVLPKGAGLKSKIKKKRSTANFSFKDSKGLTFL